MMTSERSATALSATAWADSHMSSLVCGYITPLLPELTDTTLGCFERDIAERKRTGFYFIDSFDYETWDAFYKAVCNEIERRKDNGSQTD